MDRRTKQYKFYRDAEHREYKHNRLAELLHFLYQSSSGIDS